MLTLKNEEKWYWWQSYVKLNFIICAVFMDLNHFWNYKWKILRTLLRCERQDLRWAHLKSQPLKFHAWLHWDPKAETAYCTLLMKRYINRYDSQPRPARVGTQLTLAGPCGIPIVKVPFQLKVINFILN